MIGFVGADLMRAVLLVAGLMRERSRFDRTSNTVAHEQAGKREPHQPSSPTSDITSVMVASPSAVDTAMLAVTNSCAT